MDAKNILVPSVDTSLRKFQNWHHPKNHEYDGEINETWDKYFSGTASTKLGKAAKLLTNVEGCLEWATYRGRRGGHVRAFGCLFSHGKSLRERIRLILNVL